MTLLQQANPLLRAEEEDRLSYRQKSEGTIYGRLTGCCAKAHALVFPSEISLRTQRVEDDAFADIPNLLNLKEEAKAAAAERELSNMSQFFGIRDR